jgi:hypothetical protein
MDQKQRLRALLVRRSNILKQLKGAKGADGSLKAGHSNKRRGHKKQRVVLLADMINDSKLPRNSKENVLPGARQSATKPSVFPSLSQLTKLSLPQLSPCNEPMICPNNGLHLLAAAASKYISPTSQVPAQLFGQKRKRGFLARDGSAADLLLPKAQKIVDSVVDSAADRCGQSSNPLLER